VFSQISGFFTCDRKKKKKGLINLEPEKKLSLFKPLVLNYPKLPGKEIL
jgi:hypothetical protein